MVELIRTQCGDAEMKMSFAVLLCGDFAMLAAGGQGSCYRRLVSQKIPRRVAHVTGHGPAPSSAFQLYL